jgi:hypothetical protein
MLRDTEVKAKGRDVHSANTGAAAADAATGVPVPLFPFAFLLFGGAMVNSQDGAIASSISSGDNGAAAAAAATAAAPPALATRRVKPNQSKRLGKTVGKKEWVGTPLPIGAPGIVPSQ